MKVREQIPFSFQRQFMKKPKPWKALKTRLTSLASSSVSISKSCQQRCSLKAVVRRLKCLNASSTLFRANMPTNHQPMYLKYSEKWESRNKKKFNDFPFLQRNLELCVNAWSDYEKKFIEWSAMSQQNNLRYQKKSRNSEEDQPEDYASISAKHPQPFSSKQQKSCAREAEFRFQDEANQQKIELLKSFYTVYHIDKLHSKGNKKISSIEELSNSEIVQTSVQEAPKGGLHLRRYSAQEASALSPKTLMALERWRNAQGPVFLPDKRDKKSQKRFRNDRGGSGDDSGEEDVGSGLDVWNRNMAYIEHAKKPRRSQPTYQNSSNQENGNFLPSKYTSSTGERLSFESVQSMPDIATSTTETHSKGPIITEVFSADERDEDGESEDLAEEVNDRLLGRQRAKHNMKIEEVFDHPKQKVNVSHQKSITQHPDSETNKENFNLEPLQLSSAKWNAKHRTQESSRLIDMKIMSTPDLFGRLEREIRALENRRTNRPGIRERAKLFPNNVSPIVVKGDSKTKHNYSSPPAMATQHKSAGFRRSPRFLNA